MKEFLSRDDLKEYLRAHDVTPTAQRLQIAEVLFQRPAHFSAEHVFHSVNEAKAVVSKATVYNTLGLFVEKGLINEVLVDSSKVFYDSNTSRHHHFYDIDSGEIEDIPDDEIAVDRLPGIPPGKQLENVEVIVRVRRSK